MRGAHLEQTKYKAFISYSHKDKAFVERLHRALEQYRVPGDLAGKEGAHGLIPKRLFPIFRDQDELPASSDLTAEIKLALQRSDFLIVVGSSAAAQSKWVAEEIIHFANLGKANRILAAIVPDAGDDVGYQAYLPNELVRFAPEVLAADFRKGADGWNRAQLKIVAGLLGTAYDKLAQRDAQAQRTRRIVQASAVGAIALGAMGAIYFAQNAADQRRIAAQQQQIAAERKAAQIEALVSGLHQRAENLLNTNQGDRAVRFLSIAAALAPGDQQVLDTLAFALDTTQQAARTDLGFVPTTLAPSQDSNLVFAVSAEGDLAVLDAKSLKVLAKGRNESEVSDPEGEGSDPRRVETAVSKDNRLFLSYLAAGVRVQEVSGGRVLWEKSGFPTPPYAGGITDDGKVLVFSGCQLDEFNVIDGKPTRRTTYTDANNGPDCDLWGRFNFAKGSSGNWELQQQSDPRWTDYWDRKQSFPLQVEGTFVSAKTGIAANASLRTEGQLPSGTSNPDDLCSDLDRFSKDISDVKAAIKQQPCLPEEATTSLYKTPTGYFLAQSFLSEVDPGEPAKTKAFVLNRDGSALRLSGKSEVSGWLLGSTYHDGRAVMWIVPERGPDYLLSNVGGSETLRVEQYDLCKLPNEWPRFGGYLRGEIRAVDSSRLALECSSTVDEKKTVHSLSLRRSLSGRTLPAPSWQPDDNTDSWYAALTADQKSMLQEELARLGALPQP